MVRLNEESWAPIDSGNHEYLNELLSIFPRCEMDMGSISRTILGTILNYKRVSLCLCSASLNHASLDRSSYMEIMVMFVIPCSLSGSGPSKLTRSLQSFRLPKALLEMESGRIRRSVRVG